MSDSRFGVGLSMVVVSIIMVAAFGTFLLPKNVGGIQVLIKTTTEVSTQTAFFTTLSTTTEKYTATASVTQFVTVTQTLPSSVQLSGTVTTGGIGTTPTGISFAGQHGGTAINAQVNNGQFSTTLPNGDIYSIKVSYSGTPTGGSCFVGSLILATVSSTVSAAFSC